MLPIEAFRPSASASYFNRSQGVVSSGQGMPVTEDGPAIVFLFIVMGAFAGIMAGVLLSHLLRFASMYTGRTLTFANWTIAGSALLGAAISALMVATSDQD